MSWEGQRFETAFDCVDQKVILVIDPHANRALRVESVFGDDLGPVVLLDPIGNLHRKRQRPRKPIKTSLKQAENVVELAYEEHARLFNVPLNPHTSNHSEEN